MLFHVGAFPMIEYFFIKHDKTRIYPVFLNNWLFAQLSDLIRFVNIDNAILAIQRNRGNGSKSVIFIVAIDQFFNGYIT